MKSAFGMFRGKAMTLVIETAAPGSRTLHQRFRTELQLALNSNPAAKVCQQALFQQNQPAAMFFTDDVQADYERMKACGAEFTMPPTDVTGSKIAKLNDTCGNIIQVTQLMRW